MKRKNYFLLAILFSVMIAASCHKDDRTIVVAPSDKATALRGDMRKLWEDHITWTRNVIICLVDAAPGLNEQLNRLLQNQVDIGNAIKPYYGDNAGNTLSAYLHNHIVISADVVNAAKAGNTAALTAANNRWYSNADSISIFLSQANPVNWPLDHMKKMMDEHLRLTTKEAVARINHDYPADVIAYDSVHIEILQMADMLSDGIIKQFPEKF